MGAGIWGREPFDGSSIRWLSRAVCQYHSMVLRHAVCAELSASEALRAQKIEVRNDHLFEILAELVGPRLRELKPYEVRSFHVISCHFWPETWTLEVTNLVWAYSKLSIPCASLFQLLAKMPRHHSTCPGAWPASF